MSHFCLSEPVFLFRRVTYLKSPWPKNDSSKHKFCSPAVSTVFRVHGYLKLVTIFEYWGLKFDVGDIFRILTLITNVCSVFILGKQWLYFWPILFSFELKIKPNAEKWDLHKYETLFRKWFFHRASLKTEQDRNKYFIQRGWDFVILFLGVPDFKRFVPLWKIPKFFQKPSKMTKIAKFCQNLKLKKVSW